MKFKSEKKIDWQKYRRKPIEIEAFQTETLEIIETDAGLITALPGNWIILADGEYSTVTDAVFQKEYEDPRPPLT